MKFLILALLAASVCTLSPSTPLTHQYDDMLFNNMGDQMLTVESDAEVTSTRPNILPVSKSQILKHCAEHMNKEDFENSLPIIKKTINAALKGQSHNSYHALLVAFDYRHSVARTYELTVNRQIRSLVAVLTKKNHELEKKDKNVFYFETYESVLGLPFTNIQRGPTFDSDVTSDLTDYIKQYLLRAAHEARGSQKNIMVLKGITSWISSATSAVNSITGAYKEIVSAFKTTKTSTIKEMIKGEGFSKFRSHSRFLRSLGVPVSKYNIYINSYITLVGLRNTIYSSEIGAFLSISQFLQDNSWAINDLTFDENSGGKVSNVIALTRNDMAEGVTHFITVNLKGSFSLAPNVLVISKHKSIAGGIYENTKDVRKKIPRGITNDEIKAIQSLMLLNSMKIMADAFNIPFGFPTDDPNKL